MHCVTSIILYEALKQLKWCNGESNSHVMIRFPQGWKFRLWSCGLWESVESCRWWRKLHRSALCQLSILKTEAVYSSETLSFRQAAIRQLRKLMYSRRRGNLECCLWVSWCSHNTECGHCIVQFGQLLFLFPLNFTAFHIVTQQFISSVKLQLSMAVN